MTPAQKLRMVAQLYEAAIKLKMQGLRSAHPDWHLSRSRPSLTLSSVYGEPRLTADIDVVLLLRVEDIAALRATFPDESYYVPPDETLRLELARSSRGMFTLIHHASSFKADRLGQARARYPLHARRDCGRSHIPRCRGDAPRATGAMAPLPDLEPISSLA